MSVAAAPAGLARLLMPSTLGLGGDVQVLHPETEEHRHLLDADVGRRQQADVLHASSRLLFSVKGQRPGIRKNRD